jgi:hypothetical protein
MQDRWEECLENWEEINYKIIDIQLLEFGMIEYLVDLNDIIKRLVEKDHKFESDFLEITTLEREQVRKFVDGLIGASIVLQYLSAKMERSKH